VLYGMRREAAGDLTGALKLYDAILEVDEAHTGIWKRRVAVYRQLGDTKRAAEDLCRYLDTFYTDVEGWLELADLYASRYELSRFQVPPFSFPSLPPPLCPLCPFFPCDRKQ
ncbi:hypothetical protein M407DRAFT_65759, partial [Tulasnella calospora MUT 4182]